MKYGSSLNYEYSMGSTKADEFKKLCTRILDEMKETDHLNEEEYKFFYETIQNLTLACKK